ncbi:NAD-dependent epimerase [Vitreimonas flagellata]|uniref:NAD-dependent epimerase n=1 Tax=Vitreimonas flagellata TaxID=2560861 RepID=UPI001074D35F|nr:NAD-dependent epimerase [Vitreimonas flagellata]
MTPILVTGAAGFIGFHLSQRLLSMGRPVVGLDNMSAYYDVELKRARLRELQRAPGFSFSEIDLAHEAALKQLFAQHRFETVFNLGAQAGVRYSLDNPQAYVRSNLDGFVNLLECCRHGGVQHLVFASSSSVYGAVTKMPFNVHQNVDHPLSLYAATKKSNELLAHAYAHLFRVPMTGLRFFTVYGPWGRPDMAMYLFTRAIFAGEPIDVFNNGEMERDFTYVDDVVEALVRVGDKPAEVNPNWTGEAPDPATSNAPYRIYNIGNNAPVKLTQLIELIENAVGKKAIKRMLPMQPGDVPATYADVRDLAAAVDFAPRTGIEDGVRRFVDWYKTYYGA